MHYCVLVGDERPYFTNELIKSGCIHTKEVMITEVAILAQADKKWLHSYEGSYDNRSRNSCTS